MTGAQAAIDSPVALTIYLLEKMQKSGRFQ